MKYLAKDNRATSDDQWEIWGLDQWIKRLCPLHGPQLPKTNLDNLGSNPTTAQQSEDFWSKVLLLPCIGAGGSLPFHLGTASGAQVKSLSSWDPALGNLDSLHGNTARRFIKGWTYGWFPVIHGQLGPTWSNKKHTISDVWCLNWTPGAFGRLPQWRFNILKQNLLQGRVPQEMESLRVSKKVADGPRDSWVVKPHEAA